MSVLVVSGRKIHNAIYMIHSDKQEYQNASIVSTYFLPILRFIRLALLAESKSSLAI